MKHSIIHIIAHINQSLAHDFRVTALNVPDAPIFMAVAWPLSEQVTGLKPRLPAGRGVTLAQAMRSAGAEAMELRASLAQNHMSELESLPREAGRAMVPAEDLHTGQAAWLPAQLVYLDYARLSGEAPYHDADSTGCATGATRAEAVQAALLECLERDAVALWWHGGLPPAPLALDVIDPLQPRLLWWLQTRTRHTVLLDLTRDTGASVVAAVSANQDGSVVALGSAARFDRAEASLAAVTEMLQTEAAMADAAARQDPDYNQWRDHASLHTMPQFRTTPQTPDRASDMPALLQRLAALGLAPLVADLTLPDDPQPTVRVVVPGLCAMRGQINTTRFVRLTGRRLPIQPTEIEPF